jgi:hypothetical protein
VPPKRCAVVASACVNSANNLACCFRRHADAGIGNCELDPTIGHLARAQRDRAFFGELAGVAKEIEQNLPQTHRGERAQVLLRFDQAIAKACQKSASPGASAETHR